jgi:hypothetical protein
MSSYLHSRPDEATVAGVLQYGGLLRNLSLSSEAHRLARAKLDLAEIELLLEKVIDGAY